MDYMILSKDMKKKSKRNKEKDMYNKNGDKRYSKIKSSIRCIGNI